MTATVLPGSDGQACWRSTITGGQHKNRQFLTAAGRSRLAAATLLIGIQRIISCANALFGGLDIYACTLLVYALGAIIGD